MVTFFLKKGSVKCIYCIRLNIQMNNAFYIKKNFFYWYFYINVQIQLQDDGKNKKEYNQTRELPASNSFYVSMLVSVEYFSIDKIAWICWNLYLQQLFSQQLKKVLVMKWWKIDSKCATTLKSFNESNEIIRLKWLFQVVHI